MCRDIPTKQLALGFAEKEAEAPELIGGYHTHRERRVRGAGDEGLEAHVAPVRAWRIPLEVLQIG